MTFRAIVLRENGDDIVGAPVVGDGSWVDPDPVPLAGDPPTAPPAGTWAALARSIAQDVDCNGLSRYELFVCLGPEHLDTRVGSEYLVRLIDRAREHTWGATVHVVVDGRLPTAERIQDRGESLRKCLEALAHQRVRMLQVGPGSLGLQGDPVDASLLRSKADTAEAARRDLHRLVSERAWEIEVPFAFERRWLLRRRLETTAPAARAGREGRLIVLNKSSDRDQKVALRRKRSEHLGRAVTVAMVEAPAGAGLLREQAENALPLLQYSGLLAFQYDLHILMLPLQPSPHPAIGRRVLLTSAFHPQTEPDLCVSAARDVAHVCDLLASDTRVSVHPAVTPARLAALVHRDGPIYAWIHSGHGQGGTHLSEFRQDDDDPFVAAERWWKCFPSDAQRPRLVVLMTCESAAIAQGFVSNRHAEVALGFENEVTGRSRLCARQVLEAMLRSNGDHVALSAVYESVRRQLEATEEWDVGLRLYTAEP